MRKLSLLLVPVCLIISSSCNHRNDDIGWKLRNPDEESKKEIIEDNTSRFISSQTKMRYDDGGIMVKKTSSKINFVNLINGEEAELSYNDLDSDEIPALKINGKITPIKSYEVLNQKGNDIWIRLIMEDNDSIEIVVTDIDTP